MFFLDDPEMITQSPFVLQWLESRHVVAFMFVIYCRKALRVLWPYGGQYAVPVQSTGNTRQQATKGLRGWMVWWCGVVQLCMNNTTTPLVDMLRIWWLSFILGWVPWASLGWLRPHSLATAAKRLLAGWQQILVLVPLTTLLRWDKGYGCHWDLWSFGGTMTMPVIHLNCGSTPVFGWDLICLAILMLSVWDMSPVTSSWFGPEAEDWGTLVPSLLPALSGTLVHLSSWRDTLMWRHEKMTIRWQVPKWDLLRCRAMLKTMVSNSVQYTQYTQYIDESKHLWL